MTKARLRPYPRQRRVAAPAPAFVLSKGSSVEILRKGLWVGLWLLTAFETLSMVAIGAAKFTRAAEWAGLFEGWGYGAWFAMVIGAVEVAGGLTILVPRLASYAAGALGLVMLGALYTTTTKPNELGWTGAAIHLVVLAVILVARRDVRWRPGRA